MFNFAGRARYEVLKRNNPKFTRLEISRDRQDKSLEFQYAEEKKTLTKSHDYSRPTKKMV